MRLKIYENGGSERAGSGDSLNAGRALLTGVGNLLLLHLDGPTPAQIRRRVESLLDDEAMDGGAGGWCALCGSKSDEPCVVVYGLLNPEVSRG